MLEMLMPVIVAAVMGALLVPVGKLLLNLNAGVDGLDPWIKRAVMLLLGLVAAFLTEKSGIAVPENLLMMDSVTLQGLLTWAVSLGVHFMAKQFKK